MPRFRIVEEITEERWVEADTAQDALDAWLNAGDEAVESGPYVEVKEREVYDETGAYCDTEER